MSEPAYLKRLNRASEALRALPDPMQRLDAVRLARETLDDLELETAEEARAAGATWAEIGELYGLTKQGAQQRFRPKKAKREPGSFTATPASTRPDAKAAPG